jgi:multidrug resistance efflux pump
MPELPAFDTLRLGERTADFLNFSKCFNEYKIFGDLNPEQKEIQIINKELATYQLLFQKYQAQEDNLKQDFDLALKDYERYSALYQSGSVSAKEFEDKNREYLSSKRTYENIKISNLNNRITLDNLEKNKLQLQMQAYQEREKYVQNLRQSIQSMQSGIDAWSATYLIRAPIDGKISLFTYWNQNQQIHMGEEVLTVVPVDKQEIIARLVLPVANSGKLRVGQMVHIRLQNYPSAEFGMLNGNVRTISVMPKNNQYAVEVALPDRLLTSYHKNLDYKEEMQGTAEIITQELSILGRIFHEFTAMMK